MLKNKVAIITGAAAGLGKAMTLLFARNGARIAVSDIDEEGGKKVVEEVEAAGGSAIFVRADSSSPEDNENLVREAVKRFGRLDIVVNNAGIGGPLVPIAEYTVDGWQKVIGINLSGVFYGMKYQIPAMLESGGGSIINIASILGATGTAGAAGYVAAKHGVVGLTKAGALEYAAQGIRVNAIGPGYTYTNLVNAHTMGEEGIKALETLHPLGRLGEAGEIAELALWLASDKASFVTGSYYPVDGGYLAQ